jgi:hypothetical protein
VSGEGTAPQTVPAGWYPDPADPTGQRWWDGTKWTTDVQAAAPTPATLTFGERPTLTRGSTAAANDYFERTHDYARATQDTGISHTRAGWWISFQPLWSVLPEVVGVGLLQSFAAIPQLVLVLAILIFNIAVLALQVALAFSDRKGLLAGGNATAAAPWWILLTPLVYLILRAREISNYEVGGWTAFIWWIVAVIITPGVTFLAYFGIVGLAVQ